MTTAVVVDEDVKVWVAAKTVAQEKGEFSAADVGAAAHRLFKADPKKLEKFLADRCVANMPGTAEKHYNYLFKLGPGKYRLFRQGDPIEFTHASASTSPEVHRVPPEFKSLYSASARFPDGIKPVGVPAVVPKAAEKEKPGKAAKVPETPARGLQVDMAALDQQSPSSLARRTLFDQLFLEFGKLGSQLDAHDKQSFTIQLEGVVGSVHTNTNVTVKMPNGHAVSHPVDLVVELESPTRTLFVDVVEASYRADELKSHAFDAMHLRKDGKGRYGILVFLRTPNGILQEQAEAVAYPYDFFFGVDANDAKNSSKFYALKSQILQWIQGKVKPRVGA